MNVSLLNPPFLPNFSREQRSPAVTKSGTLYFPMWLAYATGFLEKEGFNCQFIDAIGDKLSSEETVKKINAHNPQLVVITTSTPSIYNDVKIAEKIKKVLPQSFIVLVGTHVSALPKESLMLSPLIDAVVKSEYDYTLRDLAKAILKKESWSDIKGLIWREGNIIHSNTETELPRNLDEFPFVTQVYKKHLRIENYRYSSCRHPVVSLVTARGCVNNCIFCVYSHTFSKRVFRFRSADNIITELRYIKKELPQVKEIMFEDDTFTFDLKRVQKLCNLIIEEKLNLTWSANARANVDLETLKLMKKAGCRLLCVGFESGDQQILNRIKKGITLEQAQAFMKNAHKAGILIHGCFIFGHPDDTYTTMKKTLNFAKKLNPDSAQFFPIMAYPGTELYDWAKQNNYLITQNFRSWITKEGLHNCVVSRPELTNNELVNFCDRARREFYLRPRYLISKFWQIISTPKEFTRNINAFFHLIKHL